MSKRSLSRTGVVVVLALSTAIAVVFSSAASGVTSAKGTDRFTPVGTGDVQASYYTPLGISKAPAVVMVQLAGKTVAEAQGEAGRTLTEAEQKQIVDQLSAQQDALHGQIQALGGTVLANYPVGLQRRQGQHRDATRSTRWRARPASSRAPGHDLQARQRHGVPLIGAPAVWNGAAGFHGEGVKVGIIDTGIDYTHANFGGPGTAAAFNAAHATRRRQPNPALFGPAAPKVKGGIDLVGDDYDADPSRRASPCRIRTQPARLQRPRLARRRHRRGLRRRLRPAPPTPARTTRPRSPATAGPSARASRRRPTSTRSASSAARARPTSWSMPSIGPSTTTWMSSTCRSARRSARRRPADAVAVDQRRRRPASSSSPRPATKARTRTCRARRPAPMADQRRGTMDPTRPSPASTNCSARRHISALNANGDGRGRDVVHDRGPRRQPGDAALRMSHSAAASPPTARSRRARSSS